ncbi:spore germination protein [Fodinisporobacter ferrooxydans]|uniref:Spore germination protein n=1 Tax=Fodinisporobacter ferrooxydans TaxID=2901836 RepID=A0ABY4CRH1_9BACL|nr:spore germination protein [Alicyclobacillaceae bacterium MYW30-H2]
MNKQSKSKMSNLQLMMMMMIGVAASVLTFPDKLPRQVLIVSIIIGFMFLGPSTGPIMIFDQLQSERIYYPTYEEIKYIQIEDFFYNLDILGLLLWTVGSFIRISVYIFAGMKSAANVFGANKETVFAIPVAILVSAVVYSLQSVTVGEMGYFIRTYYLVAALVIGAMFPLLTLLVAKIRKIPIAANEFEYDIEDTKEWLTYAGIKQSITQMTPLLNTVILMIAIGFVEYFVFIKGIHWLSRIGK